MIDLNLSEREAEVIVDALKYHKAQVEAKKTEGKLNYINNLIDMLECRIDEHDIKLEELLYG